MPDGFGLLLEFRAFSGCAILSIMAEQEWIQQVKARGLAAPLRLLLDALEPLGPLGAQLLYVAQPAAGLWGGSQVMGHIAAALEQPDGVAQLRQLLDDTPGEHVGQ